MMNEKTARVVVVTGASSGIGRAVSLAFLTAGYSVILAGRGEEALRETLVGHESQGLVVPIDVTREHMVRSLFERAIDRFGRVDALFNNASHGYEHVPLVGRG